MRRSEERSALGELLGVNPLSMMRLLAQGEDALGFNEGMPKKPPHPE